jgi:hypothetical protein
MALVLVYFLLRKAFRRIRVLETQVESLNRFRGRVAGEYYGKIMQEGGAEPHPKEGENGQPGTNPQNGD